MAKIKDDIDANNVVDMLASSMQSDFGSESIMLMRDESRKQTKNAFSYGWKNLDDISGIGGAPRTRIIEIYGAESCGKTTLALHMAKECQMVGGIVCFIDAEHALDIEYAANLGINVKNLMLNQPDSGEQAFQIANQAILKKEKLSKDNPKIKELPLLIIIDSVAALSPESEIKGILADGKGAGLGGQARLMSEGLRGLNSVLGGTNTVVVFINQTRSKIGVSYGSPETTSGGVALKFYSSVRIKISRTGSEKIGENIIGNKIKAKIVKNKLAPPFKECEGLIVFGKGIDQLWDIWLSLQSKKLITKKGAWSSIPSLPELKSFSGYNSFKNVYLDNKKEIDNLLRKDGKNK